LSSNFGLWVEVEQLKFSLQIYGTDYQDDDDDDDDDDNNNNNDIHAIHAIFYWGVKSPSNFYNETAVCNINFNS